MRLWHALVSALLLACVPPAAAPTNQTAPHPAEQQTQSSTEATAPQPAATIRRNARPIEPNESTTVSENDCAADRATRTAHRSEALRSIEASKAEMSRRRDYATAHCKRVSQIFTAGRKTVDEHGYVRILPVKMEGAEVWSCPPGAPPGIDGNADVEGPSPNVPYDPEEYRRNIECKDVPELPAQ